MGLHRHRTTASRLIVMIQESFRPLNENYELLAVMDCGVESCHPTDYSAQARVELSLEGRVV